jgi:ankyrin repeat protein
MYLSETFGHTIDFNVQDSDGDTPLHDASRFGYTGVIAALLKGGASLWMKNHSGRTPFNEAEMYEQVEAMNLLQSKHKNFFKRLLLIG